MSEAGQLSVPQLRQDDVDAELQAALARVERAKQHRRRALVAFLRRPGVHRVDVADVKPERTWG